MRSLAAALIATLMLTLAPTSSTAAEAREMGIPRAGQWYLNTICPANDARDHYSRRIFGNRQAITIREANRRLPELRRLSRALSKASNTAARRMFNPPADWPTEAQRYATKIANVLADDSYYMAAAAGASSGRQWGKFQTKYANNSFGNSSTRIRAILNLPPSGEGC